MLFKIILKTFQHPRKLDMEFDPEWYGSLLSLWNLCQNSKVYTINHILMNRKVGMKFTDLVYF